MADGAVGEDHAVVEQALFDGAKLLDGAGGAGVALVGFELDADAAEGLDGVAQEEVFALGVDLGALVVEAVPGAADLEGAVRGVDVDVAGDAGGIAGGQVDDGEGQVGAGTLEGEQVEDPGAHLAGGADVPVAHVAPDALVEADGM